MGTQRSNLPLLRMHRAQTTLLAFDQHHEVQKWRNRAKLMLGDMVSPVDLEAANFAAVLLLVSVP